ncbi:MAG: pyridoxamine 5'-phosphate oxidase family protein, partial [Thermoanaerobaculia bacterium]|nr:pyridoxamine 5'-phosphate oxidase family protein [Thermoanaerobaculia bacterium]
MTRDEREAFLAAVRVGVLSLTDGDRGPLAAPVWYGYEPGGNLWFLTDDGSRKGRLLREGGRISLCVQTEDPPYRYVSIEGPVVEIRPADLEDDLRPMARRYLGREGGDAYVAQVVEQGR